MTGILCCRDFGLAYALRYDCGANGIGHIVEVPVDNAVGTMDLDNAFSLVFFESRGQCRTEIVKKDFLGLVSGPFDYRMTRSHFDHDIAYTMTRGLVIVDLAGSIVETHTIIDGLQGEVNRFEVQSARERTMVFQCEQLDSEQTQKRRYTLRVMRFRKGKAELLGELAPSANGAFSPSLDSERPTWFVHHERVFLFNRQTQKLDVFDGELKPTTHALAKSFNEVMGDCEQITEVVPHPTLPLALVVASLPKALRHLSSAPSPMGVFVLAWTKEKEERLAPLFGDHFSPWGEYAPTLDTTASQIVEIAKGGRWVIVRVCSDDETRDARPSMRGYVDTPYRLAVPYFRTSARGVSKPIKLIGPEGALDCPISTAFVHKPLCYVTANRQHLFRWNLDELDRAAWVQRGG